LIPEKEYSLEYNAASKEIRNEIARGFCPKLKSGNDSINEYDVIFAGSPNWFKTLAPPLLSFLRKHDFSGKKIVPFCTHGGGGFGQIVNDIAKECPNAEILPGLAVTGDFSHEQVKVWLEKVGFETKLKII
jgi:flavodoxin